MDKKPLTQEEEADEIVRRLSTPPPPPFRQMVMPVIRRILPGLIANEIIGVQPMKDSDTKIHTLKYTYDKDDTGRGS